MKCFITITQHLTKVQLWWLNMLNWIVFWTDFQIFPLKKNLTEVFHNKQIYHCHCEHLFLGASKNHYLNGIEIYLDPLLSLTYIFFSFSSIFKWNTHNLFSCILCYKSIENTNVEAGTYLFSFSHYTPTVTC